MCEVTTRNFKAVLPKLKEVLKAAKFISLDTEFSCLNASHKIQNSLFDSGNERYAKLRSTVEQMIPLQVGLSAFLFDPDNNAYNAHVYTFYIFPRSFTFIDAVFLCQSTSLQFLMANDFNFNKLIKEGISYLNSSQKQELLKRNGNFALNESNVRNEVEDLVNGNVPMIKKWFVDSKTEDVLLLKDVEKVKHNLEINYFLHKELRSRFKNLWTFEDEEGFKVQKVTSEQFEKLAKNNDLDQELVINLSGFSEVFNLLKTLEKPIIGHNFLIDLLAITHHFEKPLPKSYTSFKRLVHSLFPNVYDTKCLSFDILSLIPDNKRWRKNTLACLYEYFKDGNGRHLTIINSPLIECTGSSQQTFHSAGWDSYCTGYIFIRMAHIYASQNYSQIKGKRFMSGELLQAVEKYKNSINIIRGDVSHIQLDGQDPVSKRPPWLIIQTKNKQINITHVTSLLSTYGYVEVKPHSYKGRSAIIAVDNFGSARRILKQFNSHSDFKIQEYNALKHSTAASALWTGFLMSGMILAWYGYSKIK